MKPMPASLIAKRAELADNYAETHSVFTKELHGNIVADYIAGFDMCYALMSQREERLVNMLNKCKAAMMYAYEDHSDQYYLNVNEDIINALYDMDIIK